jgi:hypothetical protein
MVLDYVNTDNIFTSCHETTVVAGKSADNIMIPFKMSSKVIKHYRFLTARPVARNRGDIHAASTG